MDGTQGTFVLVLSYVPQHQDLWHRRGRSAGLHIYSSGSLHSRLLISYVRSTAAC
jgi:hypothetical protein